MTQVAGWLNLGCKLGFILPGYLKLDLFAAVVALVFDADNGMLRHANAFAADLDSELLSRLKPVSEPADLLDKLFKGIFLRYVSVCHSTSKSKTFYELWSSLA